MANKSSLATSVFGVCGRALRRVGKCLSWQRPATTQRAKTGRAAEALAARFLGKRGYRIVARNWRAGKLELDLICRDGKQLVFVEVRARHHTAAVDGLGSVSHRKRKTLRRAIHAYLRTLREPVSWRFDIVAVSVDATGAMTPTHYECCAI